MATAANLIVQVTANASKLQSDLSNAKSNIDAFASNAISSLSKISLGLGAAAAAGGGLLLHSLNDSANAIDEMAHSAEKFGISVGSFQKLKYQADQADVSVDTLGTGLKFMLKNVQQAADGTGTAQHALEKLGLSANYLKNLSPEQQFYAIAQALRGVSNQNEKVNDLMEIFGRSGIELLPVVNSNLQETGANFDKLGVTISKTQAEAVDAFDKSKKTLATLFEGFKQQVAAEVTPAFEAIISSVNNTVVGMGGIKSVAIDVAKAVVDAANAMVTAFAAVADTAKLAGSAVDIAKGVGSKLGRLAFDTFGPSGNPNPGQVELPRKGPDAAVIAEDTQIGGAVQKFLGTIDTFGQGSKALLDLSKNLENQAAILKSGKSVTDVAQAVGFGNQPNTVQDVFGNSKGNSFSDQKSVDVNVVVSFDENGNLVSKVVNSQENAAKIQQISKSTVNDAARNVIR